MLTIISYILGITLIFNLLLVSIAYFKQNKRLKTTTLIFGAILFFDGIWAACIMYLINQPPTVYNVGSSAYLVSQITFFSAVMWNIFKVIFYKIVFVKEKIIKSIYDYIVLILFTISLFGCLINNGLFTELIISSKVYIHGNLSGVFPVFTIYMLYAYFYGIVILFRKRKKINNYIIKKQINFLLFSHAFFIGFSILTNLLFPYLFEIYYFNSLGPTFTLFSLGIYAYLIQRYHFLDLRLNLQKILTYGTTTLILAPSTFYIFSLCAKSHAEPSYTCLIVPTVFFLVFFLPIRKLLNQLFNLLLYGKKQNYQEKIRFLSDKLSNGKLVLDKALQQILNTLNQTFNLKDCFFMPHWELALIGVNFQDNQILYRTELACRGEQENNLAMQRLAKNMAKRKIAILAPIKQNGKYSGALALQDKNQDNELFSSEELNSIRDLANKTVVFLNNLAKQYKEKEYFCQFQHFFRTPLSIACARLNMIMERFKQDAQTYEELKLVEQSLNKVVRFSTNFINFMSIDWSAEFFKEPTSLKQALKAALNKIPSALAERDQKFEPKISLKGKTDLTVLGSPGTLSAVLSELIVNALIFDSGEAEIAVITSRKFQTATIIISNVGTLTKKEIQTALTPFGCVQGNHHSISVNFVQVFAEAVGGHFTLMSSRGKTYAKLTLPLAKKIPQVC